MLCPMCAGRTCAHVSGKECWSNEYTWLGVSMCKARGRHPAHSTSPLDKSKSGLMCSISIFSPQYWYHHPVSLIQRLMVFSTSLLFSNSETESRSPSYPTVPCTIGGTVHGNLSTDEQTGDYKADDWRWMIGGRNNDQKWSKGYGQKGMIGRRSIKSGIGNQCWKHLQQ